MITGLASVPLLLAKLYAVSPQLLRRPAVRGPVDAMERLACCRSSAARCSCS